MTHNGSRLNGVLPFFFASVVFLIYLPGIYNGIALLDDNHVLAYLSDGREFSWLDGFLNYLYKQGSLTARPLSYLSFYLQKEQYGTDLSPFKLVNVILHAANSVLVFFVAKNLAAVLSKRGNNNSHYVVASVCMLYWALSPIQVSTVLYLTQRMAELSSFFSLLALIVFINARELNGHKGKQFFLLFMVVSPLVVLGILSKQNAILTLLSIILLDLTIFSSSVVSSLYRVWKVLAVYLPLLCVIFYFIARYDTYFIQAYTIRDYSVGERLLTQSRVLVDYLLKFLFPNSFEFGVISPQIEKSTSLWSPLSTLYSSLFLLFGFFVSVCYRKKSPVLAFGLLFFLANHLLESTILGLELYFEHRNYLALFGIAFALSFGVVQLFYLDIKKLVKVMILAALVFYFIFVSYKSFWTIQLWSKPLQQAAYWYQLNPKSQRTHSHLGQTLFNFGMYPQAEEFYRTTVDDFPDDPTKQLLWLELICIDSSMFLPNEDTLLQIMGAGRFYDETLQIFDSIVKLKEKGRCNALSDVYILKASSALLSNPNYDRKYDSLYILNARIFQANGDFTRAAEQYQKALEKSWRLDIALSLTEKYLLLGRYAEAKVLYEYLIDKCRVVSRQCSIRQADIKYLNDALDLVQRQKP